MLNLAGTMHGGCAVFLVDLYVSHFTLHFSSLPPRPVPPFFVIIARTSHVSFIHAHQVLIRRSHDTCARQRQVAALCLPGD